ncbi:hypothetical protein [Streptosporangium sp. LJ11]
MAAAVEAGRDDAEPKAEAETLAMLRDALMIGCFLGDPDVTRRMADLR